MFFVWCYHALKDLSSIACFSWSSHQWCKHLVLLLCMFYIRNSGCCFSNYVYIIMCLCFHLCFLPHKCFLSQRVAASTYSCSRSGKSQNHPLDLPLYIPPPLCPPGRPIPSEAIPPHHNGTGLQQINPNWQDRQCWFPPIETWLSLANQFNDIYRKIAVILELHFLCMPCSLVCVFIIELHDTITYTPAQFLTSTTLQMSQIVHETQLATSRVTNAPSQTTNCLGKLVMRVEWGLLSG